MLAKMKAKHNKSKKRPVDADADLASMILAKREERSSFLDDLEAKYSQAGQAGNKRRKGGKK